MKEKKSVRIIVAVHKDYPMPSDDIYLPVHVGAALSRQELDFIKDSEGDNISEKNPYYCELTALYWAWKNVDADHLGLVHYRRYFTLSKKGGRIFDSILRSRELIPLLQNYRLIVPKRRRYLVETLYSHYANTHYREHLDTAEKIIAEMYPEYLHSCKTVYNSRSGYMFNMLIAEKRLFDDYCKWLFGILFELEKRLGSSTEKLSDFQKRLYGRVSEILFNVWLTEKISRKIIKKSEIRELKVLYTERIDYRRKIISFVKAKLFGKKYEGSF